MATKSSAAASAASMRSSPQGISPNQTTSGRMAPVRQHPSQIVSTDRSPRHSSRRPHQPQRALSSSPCMWCTCGEPACSCRSSMFCVQRKTPTPAASRASAAWAALGFAARRFRRRRL